jgi:hypothetical protein
VAELLAVPAGASTETLALLSAVADGRDPSDALAAERRAQLRRLRALTAVGAEAPAGARPVPRGATMGGGAGTPAPVTPERAARGPDLGDAARGRAQRRRADLGEEGHHPPDLGFSPGPTAGGCWRSCCSPW